MVQREVFQVRDVILNKMMIDDYGMEEMKV